MSYVAVNIPMRALRHADVTLATLHRYGIRYVDFRFSRAILKQAGWTRVTCIAPFADTERPGIVMFAPAEKTNPSARALSFTGGIQLSVRFARMGIFADLVPEELRRKPIAVRSCHEGQVVLDLANLQQPVTNP